MRKMCLHANKLYLYVSILVPVPTLEHIAKAESDPGIDEGAEVEAFCCYAGDLVACGWLCHGLSDRFAWPAWRLQLECCGLVACEGDVRNEEGETKIGSEDAKVMMPRSFPQGGEE